MTYEVNWFIHYGFVIQKKRIQANHSSFLSDPVSCKVNNIKMFHPQIFIEIS